jgi:hypothetical protein
VANVFSKAQPEYDLEVAVKMISDPSGARRTAASIIVSFESPENFLALTVDALQKTWTLCWVCGGPSELATILNEVEEPSIRAGAFYSVLIQVRAGAISVDINSIPVFTAVKIPEAASKGSLVGVLAANSKFAIKGWKIRAVGAGSYAGTRGGFKKLDLAIAMKVQPTIPRAAGGAGATTSASSASAPSSSATSPPPPPKGIKSLSDYITSSAAVSPNRLGPPPLPLGGGGPGKPRNLTYADLASEQSSDHEDDKIRTSCNDYESDLLHRQSSTSMQISTPNAAANFSNSQDNKIAKCTLALFERHDKALVQSIMCDIVKRDLGVSFDDIAALNDAKRLLNEAIVLPLIMPEFFTGIREPWKGVLLFGYARYYTVYSIKSHFKCHWDC